MWAVPGPRDGDGVRGGGKGWKSNLANTRFLKELVI